MNGYSQVFTNKTTTFDRVDVKKKEKGQQRDCSRYSEKKYISISKFTDYFQRKKRLKNVIYVFKKIGIQKYDLVF